MTASPRERPLATSSGEAARENDALLRTIRLHSMVSVTDGVGCIVEVNDAFCAASGYSRTELLGQNHRMLNSGVQDDAFWTDMWRDIAAGTPWRGEICNRTKNGSLYWVDSIIVPLLGEDGRVKKYISIRNDVTAAKLAERAVQSSEAFLDRAGTIARVGGWELDLRTRAVTWSAQMYRMHEVDADYVPRQETFGAFYPAATRAIVERAVEEGIAHGTSWDLEVPFVTAKGHELWMRAVGNSVLEDGVPVRLVGILQDISDRKRADQARDASEARYRTLFECAPDGIVIADADGHYLEANASVCRMLGYTRDELTALHSSDVVSPSDVEHIETALNAVRTEPDYHREWSLRRKDGSMFPADVIATQMPDGNVLGMIQDATERNRIEGRLRNAKRAAESANRAKSDFLADMSHEIRTPMSAVIGLSYLLGRTALDAEQLAFLTKIKVASGSMLAVLNDVLDLSKIESGELTIERATFSPRELLRELAEGYAGQAATAGITFELDAPHDLPAALEGDVTLLRQILVNLLSNAIKFTQRGGVVLRVRRIASPSGNMTLTFVVQDTGIGIAADAQERLFTQFVQADASIARRFGGTGLGLSIVKRLVSLLDGEVRLTSTLGVGTEFRVVLTFALASAEALTPPDVAATLGEHALLGVRVLVVDDSDINRDVTKRILELEGARVTVDVNGQEAFDRLRRNPNGFDVVLMDVQMPVLDGHAAASRIRSELGLMDLPIIALTADARASERARSVEAGMDDFIVKPFGAHALLRGVLRHAAPTTRQERPAQLDVTLEADASPTAAWPAIDGIDAVGTCARLGGNVDLFRSLLERFLTEYADVAIAIDVDDPALLTLHGSRMHKLRGAAGLLGATMVERLAAEAEEACTSNAPSASSAAPLAVAIAAALDSLRASTAAAFAITAGGSLRPAGEPIGLDELMRLLRLQHLSALGRFDAIAPELQGRLGDDAFQRVREHVDNLRFGEAATALAVLQA